jgi:hypothetical protein
MVGEFVAKLAKFLMRESTTGATQLKKFHRLILNLNCLGKNLSHLDKARINQIS